MNAVIDWPLMRAERWNNTQDDTERMSRRMAEFLIHDFAPLSIFEGIVVYDHGIVDYVKKQISRFGLSLKTGVQPGWYY